MASKILRFVKQTFGLSECIVCGNIITGSYYMDELGNKVCMQHKDNVINCLSCGCLFSKEKATSIGYDQYICASCVSHSPQDADIPKMSDYVRKGLSDSGIEGIPSFTLHSVELDVLI